MNPHQKNKIDVSTLSPEEQRLFRLYGKLPSRSDHFAKHLKDRKYFDSGDYAMSKAGKGDGVDAGAVGSQHPVPENIPHLSSPVNGSATLSGTNGAQKHQSHPIGTQAGSPVKESSFLQRETSADEVEGNAQAQAQTDSAQPQPQGTPTPTAKAESIPIRR